MTDTADGPWTRFKQPAPAEANAGPWTRYQQQGQADPEILARLNKADTLKRLNAAQGIVAKPVAVAPTATSNESVLDPTTGVVISDAANTTPQEPTAADRAPWWSPWAKMMADRPEAAAKAKQDSVDQARLLIQGATLGAGDELEAGLRTGFGFAGDYDSAVAGIRDSIDRGREARGGAALEIIGGVVGPGYGVGKFIAGAPRLVDKTMRGATAGLGIGGVNGFNSGENIDDRLEKAETGAKIGAVVGGAAVPAIALATAAVRGASNVASTVADGIGARLGINDEGAARRLLADALLKERPGTAPRDVAAQTAARAIEKVGPNGTATPLAIVGSEGAQDAARAAAAASPTARRAITDAVDAAQATAGARTRELIDPTEYARTMETLTERRTVEAQRAYDRLYTAGEHASPANMADVISTAPGMQQAVRQASRWLRNQGLPAIQQAESMSAREVDYVTRALDDQVSTAFRLGQNENGHALRQLRDSWVSAAYQRVPGYQRVRNTYAQQSADIRALELGRDLIGREGADSAALRAQFDALPANRQQLARTGAMQVLHEQSQNAGDVGRWATATVNRGATRDAIEHIFANAGDQAHAAVARAQASSNRRALAAALQTQDRAYQLQRLPAAVRRDSEIAAGAAAMSKGMPEATTAVERAAGGFDPIRAVWRPGTGMLDVARSAVSLATDPMNARRAEAMARMLTDRQGQDVLALARELAARPDAQSVARLRALQQALAAKATMATGGEAVR